MRKSDLGAIFGSGRSGTTWLGALVSSHPDVAYRFEPLHRAQNLGGVAQAARARMHHSPMASEDLTELYEALLVAHPELEKPPFFPKRYPMVVARGRRVLWPLARKSRAAAALFRFLYTPKGRPFLLFKEVAEEETFRRLVQHTRIPLVYLVRHPCATVHSIVAGQRRGLMPSGRQGILGDFLKKYAPQLAERFGGRVNTMTPHEKAALLWRATAERCWEVLGTRGNLLPVFYERLCMEPISQLTAVLRLFGLDMESQVLRFLEASTGKRMTRARLSFGEIGISDYFSVFRDPAQSMSHWKRALDPAERKRIMKLVEDSPVFAAGMHEASWDE